MAAAMTEAVAKGHHMTQTPTDNAFIVRRSRRRFDRVAGPFDGVRVGRLETPMRIHDLSLGGCFVNSTQPQKDGSKFVLKIELPEEGWITVNAETLYGRPGAGFAVRFVDVDDETSARLVRTVEALKRQAGS